MKKGNRYIGAENIFAIRLNELMVNQKITQQELAEKVEITRQAIAKYTEGFVLPNIEKLCLIAEFFNVSADYLLGRTEFKTFDYNSELEAEMHRANSYIKKIARWIESVPSL